MNNLQMDLKDNVNHVIMTLPELFSMEKVYELFSSIFYIYIISIFYI